MRPFQSHAERHCAVQSAGVNADANRRTRSKILKITTPRRALLHPLRLLRLALESRRGESAERAWMVQLGGFEPPTSGSTDRRSNHLSYSCTATRARARAWRRAEPMGTVCRWQARPAASPAIKKQSPGGGPGCDRLTVRFDCLRSGQARERCLQATFLKTLLTLSLTGSAVSVATFWASAARSLV